MCGIFGVISNGPSDKDSNFVRGDWNALMKNSLSRGRDSSGLILLDVLSSKMSIIKGNLPLSELVRSKPYQSKIKELETSQDWIAMGHARLVTNGSPMDNENNQPVSGNNGYLIHNGIVINDNEIWKQFPNLTRKYEIDSEIILALIELNLNQGWEKAISLANSYLKGTYSYACILPSQEAVVLSSNNGSLYFYKDTGKLIFASERSFLENLESVTNKHAINQISNGRFIIFNFKGNEVQRTEDLIKEEDWNGEVTFHNLMGVGNGTEVVDCSVFSDSKFQTERNLLEYNWEEIKFLKRCTKCVLPETFPFIRFDEQGECNYCKSSKPIQVKGNLDDLQREIAPFLIRDRDNCIVPLSGGRDSIYSLHLVKEVMGLKPVTMTYDWGMVTDLARRNIARACGELGVENVIFAADSELKRKNIRLNLQAWLKNPNLGMVPLFMAGDKYFFHYCSELQHRLGIDLNIWGAHQYENTDFKIGFAGVSPNFDKDKIYSLSLMQKLKLVGFVGKEFVMNPSYFNSSLWDTLGAYKARDQFNFNGHFQIFDYFEWDEKSILSTIENKYGWERAIDSDSTWRIGDGTSSFYNYIYFVVAGFSEVETFRSNQIRNGKLTRDEALKRIEQENHPRFESIKWYLHMIGLDFEMVIKKINSIPKLYRAQ